MDYKINRNKWVSDKLTPVVGLLVEASVPAVVFGIVGAWLVNQH